MEMRDKLRDIVDLPLVPRLGLNGILDIRDLSLLDGHSCDKTTVGDVIFEFFNRFILILSQINMKSTPCDKISQLVLDYATEYPWHGS